jgi:hypothetical protein
VKIREHLQVSEILQVKNTFKRKLSFKIISQEGPVISTQKHKLLNDIHRSSAVSQSNGRHSALRNQLNQLIVLTFKCIITKSTSNFLQPIEFSPIRNETWYLTGQTVPSYATAAIYS